MTLSTFLIKLGGLGFNLLLLFGYMGIRTMIKGRKYFFTETNREADALRRGKVPLRDLAQGIWNVNTEKVISYASFGLGTVVLAAIFIYEQKLSGYDALFFYILLSMVAISMLAYFLSLQLWFLVMDLGGTINSKILYRHQATLFQVIGWYAIHMSIILAILAVNTVSGYIFSFINMGAVIYLLELKAIVALREQFDEAGMNDFQKSLDLHTIYEKNEAARLSSYRGQPLRLLSWNIERGFDPDRLIKYIQTVDADIVCLQEVDWGNERTGGADVLNTIACRTGMIGYFGIEFFEIASPYRNTRTAGGGVHGNAILSKVRPSVVYRLELPVLFDWQNPPATKEAVARSEKRVGVRFALCADFRSKGPSLTVCTTHFEDKMGGVDGRITQYRHLVQSLKNPSSPRRIEVIAGDMNTLDNWLARRSGATGKRESKEKPWWISECEWWKTRVLADREYQDPFSCRDWTYKRTWLYRQKLDWILVQNAKVVDKGIGDFNSSDHRPLWIDIVPE